MTGRPPAFDPPSQFALEADQVVRNRSAHGAEPVHQLDDLEVNFMKVVGLAVEFLRKEIELGDQLFRSHHGIASCWRNP